MESLPKMHHSHLSLNPSAPQRGSKPHRSSLPSPFSSLSPSLPPFSPIRVSSPKPQNPLLQTLGPLVKPACVAIAATAFFLTRLQSPPLAAAAPPASPTESETLSADALRSLVEDKIRARKVDEAIRVLERLINLEPEELEYPLLRAHLHLRNGEHELAASGFDDMLKKDPLYVEAYRGLLMANSEMKKPTKELLKRIEEAVRVCQEREEDFDVRDFKLLIAQIKVIDGDLSDALKVYEELVKEEPKDFRPYLCQGIVYTMLRKKDEAEKQFEKYRTLVPENHPHKKYFEDSTQILGRGRVGAKS